jgi:hypothetical protein
MTDHRDVNHAPALQFGGGPDVDRDPPRGYQARLEANLCVQGLCPERPVDGADRCARHRAEQLERNRAWSEQRRKSRKRAKLCRDCGKPSKRRRCPACRIVDGRVPQRGADSGVDSAARTRKHADGRTRYHGQGRQGRQTNANLADGAIRQMQKLLEKAAAGLAYAESLEVQAQGRIVQGDARRAWLSLVHLAIRLGEEEVLELYRYEHDLAGAAPRPK